MKGILFFDLEWVPITKTFSDLYSLNPDKAKTWSNRCDRWRSQGKFPDMTDDEIWLDSAGLNPEFIKIVVASFGFEQPDGTFKVHTIAKHDEEELLRECQTILNNSTSYRLCGHAIKRYDMPYLAKRMLINGINLPYQLNNYGKKPWDLTAIDTAEMWGCGVMAESYTPLDTICGALDIPTSKSDIAGKDVQKVYYDEGDEGLQRIATYCGKDVEVTAKVYKKINDLIT